jgi:hypothetical protein
MLTLRINLKTLLGHFWRTLLGHPLPIGIGSGFWCVVGEVEELIDKAREMAQRTLFGIGFARILNKK